MLLFFTLLGCSDMRAGIAASAIPCDVHTLCPDGMRCISFNGNPAICAEEDPCSYACDSTETCIEEDVNPLEISCEGKETQEEKSEERS